MSTQDGPPHRAMDPLLAGVTDGVATGYRALELVTEGLRESIRLQAAASPRPQSARPPGRSAAFGAATPGLRPAPAAGGKSPAGLVQDLAGVLTDALGAASTVVEDIALAIGQQSHGGGDQLGLVTLTLSAPAGSAATIWATVWDTGPTLLCDVKLSATDLIGDGFQIPAAALTFAPDPIKPIPPGKGEAVEISVAVPAETPPGLCRGVVVATPGDACAVLELTVTAAPQS